MIIASIIQDDHDLRVFRVCSLWFSNSHDDNITSILKVLILIYNTVLIAYIPHDVEL